MARPLFSTIRSLIPPFRRTLCGTLLALGVAGVSGGGCQTQTKPVAQIAEIPAGSFTSKWNADLALKGDKATEIFVRDNLIIVYTREHYAYVLDRESGAAKWVAAVRSGGVKLRPPIVLKDYVIFPTISTMEVYDRFGRNHRSVQSSGLALRSGAVGNGTKVYFGSDDPHGGRVVCLDLAGSQYQSSSVAWTLQTLSGISATPTIHQGLLYAGDDSGGVYAVNADSRAPIWAIKHEGREQGVFDAGTGVRADLKSDEFGVYVASLDTKLYCIGRTDGRIRWQYFAGQPLLHSPTITPTTVYEYIDDRGLIAIDKTQGDPARKAKWTVAAATQFLAEDDKYAYLEGNDHSILAADKTTGEVKFRSKRTDFISYGTSVKSTVVFAVTADGEVRAVTPILKAGVLGPLVWDGE